jgi:chromosomal replication initiation ATPase DnaA
MEYRVDRFSPSSLARRVDLATHAVAVAFDVEAGELKSPTRGEQDICFARQTAMYLAHVALGMSLNQVARGFGRDRTTARHACRVVEDRRDEPDFDERMRVVESALSYFRGLAGLR